jgi:hypothetical protein
MFSQMDESTSEMSRPWDRWCRVTTRLQTLRDIDGQDERIGR